MKFHKKFTQVGTRQTHNPKKSLKSTFFLFHFFDIFEWLLLVVIYHILYFITRGSLGYGDIKVFCVLVLNLNFFEGIYLFAFTFLYAGFFALGILVFKKVKRGTKIPLVPFIALGYFSVLLIREGILW